MFRDAAGSHEGRKEGGRIQIFIEGKRRGGKLALRMDKVRVQNRAEFKILFAVMSAWDVLQSRLQMDFRGTPLSVTIKCIPKHCSASNKNKCFNPSTPLNKKLVTTLGLDKRVDP